MSLDLGDRIIITERLRRIVWRAAWSGFGGGTPALDVKPDAYEEWGRSSVLGSQSAWYDRDVVSKWRHVAGAGLDVVVSGDVTIKASPLEPIEVVVVAKTRVQHGRLVRDDSEDGFGSYLNQAGTVPLYYVAHRLGPVSGFIPIPEPINPPIEPTGETS